MPTFCERLNELKSKNGVMQKDVAAGVNIPLRTFQRYEHGEREPSASVVVALADYFGVSADYLLGRSDRP